LALVALEQLQTQELTDQTQYFHQPPQLEEVVVVAQGKLLKRVLEHLVALAVVGVVLLTHPQLITVALEPLDKEVMVVLGQETL
jgi:hypothetical protein